MTQVVPSPARRLIRASVPLDAVSLLTVYLVLLLIVPSNRTVSGIGSIGIPAVLWGFAAALWWIWHRVRRATVDPLPRAHIVRILLFCLAISVVISYLIAMTRAIPTVEISPADNGLLRIVSWSGIMLVASEGVPSMNRLLVLLRRLILGVGFVAAVGLAEFITKRSIVAAISIPGLTASSDYAGVITRGDLVRSASTAEHPLEYGMLLAMALPIALTLAIYDTRGRRSLAWILTGLIGVALLTAGSRSAVIGLVLALVPLVPTWSRVIRVRIGIAAAAALLGILVLVPAVLSNLRSLFSVIGGDSSTLSRTESLGVFVDVFTTSPVFGRGFGTFLPMYRIFDNQYLGLLVELGVIGTIAFAAIMIVPGFCAIQTGRALVEELEVIRKLGAAFGAAMLVALALSGFFDALSFPKAAGMVFFVGGLAGAYVALGQRGVTPLPPHDDRLSLRSAPNRPTS